MKIEKIEVIDGIHHVTKRPNIIGRLFGKKTTVERYRTYGKRFHYAPNDKVFYKENGEIVDWVHDPMHEVLNNFDRSF